MIAADGKVLAGAHIARRHHPTRAPPHRQCVEPHPTWHPPRRHCEERSDAAIQRYCLPAPPRLPTYPKSPRPCGPRDDENSRHCEERSDAAIQTVAFPHPPRPIPHPIPHATNPRETRRQHSHWRHRVTVKSTLLSLPRRRKRAGVRALARHETYQVGTPPRPAHSHPRERVPTPHLYFPPRLP